MTAQWYDRSNLEDLVIPENEFSQKAIAYFLPLIRQGVSSYIQNVESDLGLVQVDDLVFPVTVNSKEYQNSYVVSPYTHYVSYAEEELGKLRKPWLEAMLRPVIRVLGGLLRLGSVNRVVIVNNWLFSTNLYPQISEGQIQQIVALLQARFPSHAIVFRSVYPIEGQVDSRWARARLVFSRQVYFWKGLKVTQDLSRDFKLLARSTHTVESLSSTLDESSDRSGLFDRLTTLYRALYIQKYSRLNPQYLPQFWEHALKTRALSIQLLKNADCHSMDVSSIEGFCTFFDVGQTTSSPAIGYEVARPQKLGLYRMVEALSFRRSMDRHSQMNLSAGAPQFKRARGGVAQIEYMAVFTEHLSGLRDAPWWLLQKIANGLALSLVQENEL